MPLFLFTTVSPVRDTKQALNEYLLTRERTKERKGVASESRNMGEGKKIFKEHKYSQRLLWAMPAKSKPVHTALIPILVNPTHTQDSPLIEGLGVINVKTNRAGCKPAKWQSYLQPTQSLFY